MRRREFIALAAGAAVSRPVITRARPGADAAQLGVLATGFLDSPETRSMLSALGQGLREHGYVEGTNIRTEYRAAEGEIERFPALAADLVRLKVDLIIAGATPAARAAQQATMTIPIVAPVMGDPVGDGLVASLARPGGNITGLTFLGPELVQKRLGLLKELLPTLSRVAVLWHLGAFSKPTTEGMLNATSAAGQSLRLQIQPVRVQSADELELAFSAMSKARAEALVIFPSSMLFAYRRRIVDLAVKQGLPSIGGGREYSEVGGLMAYGADVNELMRRGATYVHKILNGAKPAELPVEQPTKFDLVINLRTAQALNIEVPPQLQQRADEVIE